MKCIDRQSVGEDWGWKGQHCVYQHGNGVQDYSQLSMLLRLVDDTQEGTV
jgi:hypothetical protein